MDRLIANNTVAYGSHDVAPLSGTPGMATDGNPALSVPATDWPAWAWNMLSEEIRNVVIAAGLTPSNSDWTQLREAVKVMAKGRLLRVVTLNVGSGTYTAGSDAKAIRVRMVGGGGGGGGSVTTAANGTSTAAPGSAGAYVESYHTSGFAGGIAYTVGAKGTGGTGAAGNDGHDTTLAISGGTLTAGKGKGGGVSGAALVALSGGNGTASSASGGNLRNAPGGTGTLSLVQSASFGAGGEGGRSEFGPGGIGPSVNANGGNAVSPGAGGSGTVCFNNGSSALTGGNGADGLIIIEEFG